MHWGAGFPSQVATAAYEGARDAVLDFVGARPDDVVVFTKHTTEAVNVLAAALPDDARAVVFAGEHHANLLPWLRRRVTVLPVPESPGQALDLLDAALTEARGAVGLVTVAGASNVTGEIWPYPEIAALAHRHGARVLLDAAQLAPHRPVDMAATGVDHLAFSGHKLYARSAPGPSSAVPTGSRPGSRCWRAGARSATSRLAPSCGPDHRTATRQGHRTLSARWRWASPAGRCSAVRTSPCPERSARAWVWPLSPTTWTGSSTR